MRGLEVFRRRTSRVAMVGACFFSLWFLAGCATTPEPASVAVPRWGKFETSFVSALAYTNPVQQAELRVHFRSPSGKNRTVYGFWDGGNVWRVRFSPDEPGAWQYLTDCTDADNSRLHRREGMFRCGPPSGTTRFAMSGPVRLSPDRRYLVHANGRSFFWLADTAWNGALRSTEEEWEEYLTARQQQGFTAVQWVATQWRAAPDGDLTGRRAYTGRDRIEINPEFFQRLDQKAEAVAAQGLLNVPVLLWAIGGGSDPAVNPGHSLPEDQAVLLARYMVARWNAYPVVWILPGDGDYRGEKAARWKRIGRAVFAGIDHAPVALHPGGMHWPLAEFQNEEWLDLFGYQSGHGDSPDTLAWLVSGPPSRDWQADPPRPFINLEPPYEFHLAYHSKKRLSPHSVRRAMYWSLLAAPVAGVSYGGHGVWGWDDGATPPVDHPNAGIPLPWREALRMPAAEQVAHMAALFQSIEFWKLRPAPDLLAHQPGSKNPAAHIAAARSDDMILIYSPEPRLIELFQSRLPHPFSAHWVNPRTGQRETVAAVVTEKTIQFATPSAGDWLLLLEPKSNRPT